MCSAVARSGPIIDGFLVRAPQVPEFLKDLSTFSSHIVSGSDINEAPGIGSCRKLEALELKGEMKSAP